MRLPARPTALFFAAVFCVSAALAAMALWIVSRARTPLDYLIVGTLGTAVVMAGVFAVLVRRKLL